MPLAGFRRIVIVIAIDDVGLKAGERRGECRQGAGATRVPASSTAMWVTRGSWHKSVNIPARRRSPGSIISTRTGRRLCAQILERCRDISPWL